MALNFIDNLYRHANCCEHCWTTGNRPADAV